MNSIPLPQETSDLETAAVSDPAKPRTAVCVLGAWRSLDQSASSIRKHMLDPLNADAYAVIEAQAEHHTEARCELLLGPRASGRCRVGKPTSSLYREATRRSFESARGCLDKRRSGPTNQATVWLQQDACLAMIQRAQTDYATFAYTRTDQQIFHPLPPAMMRSFGPDEVIVPDGDRWGGGLTDNMLIGGGRGFRVASSLWRQALSDGSTACATGWVSERFLLLWLQANNVSYAAAPVAYCKVDASTGACRYPGQLAASMRLVPGLVARQPSLASLVCAWTPCECSDAPCTPQRAPAEYHPGQTREDWDADPYFCNLRRAACQKWPFLHHLGDAARRRLDNSGWRGKRAGKQRRAAGCELNGSHGGAWSACTHLRLYGMNVDSGLAQGLAAILTHTNCTTSLEFGAGLGLYSSFLAKTIRGMTDAVALEPNSMRLPVEGIITPAGLPRQVSLDAVSATAAQLTAHGLNMRFDAVFSIEVLEHIPRELHAPAFDFLFERTGRVFIFGMAAPGQPGTGHIATRRKQEVKDYIVRRGWRYLKGYTRALAKAVYPPIHERNIMVFASGISDIFDAPPADLIALARPQSWSMLNGRHSPAMKAAKAQFAKKWWPALSNYIAELQRGNFDCPSCQADARRTSIATARQTRKRTASPQPAHPNLPRSTIH